MEEKHSKSYEKSLEAVTVFAKQYVAGTIDNDEYGQLMRLRGKLYALWYMMFELSPPTEIDDFMNELEIIVKEITGLEKNLF